MELDLPISRKGSARSPPAVGFSRNLRKEVAKSRKVFFLDLGIRNALLNAFQPPPLRDDMGRLWENYLVLERHNSPVPAAPVRSGLSSV